MSKLKKTIITIFLLLFMFLCFSVIVSNQKYVSIPFYLLNLDEYPLVGNWLPAITFYLAGSLFIVLFVLMLITIFYPKKFSQFRFRKTEGVLLISKKAVEGVVTEALVAEKLMENPNVKAIMSQRKIKIRVKGDFRIVSDLYKRTDQWSEQLETQLHDLIGSDVKISIKIKFEKPRSINNNRVK